MYVFSHNKEWNSWSQPMTWVSLETCSVKYTGSDSTSVKYLERFPRDQNVGEVTRDYGEMGMTLCSGYRVSLWGDERILEIHSGVTQQCELTKCYWIVCLKRAKMANFMYLITIYKYLWETLGGWEVLTEEDCVKDSEPQKSSLPMFSQMWVSSPKSLWNQTSWTSFSGALG